jgi:hypothetical protein
VKDVVSKTKSRGLLLEIARDNKYNVSENIMERHDIITPEILTAIENHKSREEARRYFALTLQDCIPSSYHCRRYAENDNYMKFMIVTSILTDMDITKEILQQPIDNNVKKEIEAIAKMKEMLLSEIVFNIEKDTAQKALNWLTLSIIPDDVYTNTMNMSREYFFLVLSNFNSTEGQLQFLTPKEYNIIKDMMKILKKKYRSISFDRIDDMIESAKNRYDSIDGLEKYGIQIDKNHEHYGRGIIVDVEKLLEVQKTEETYDMFMDKLSHMLPKDVETIHAALIKYLDDVSFRDVDELYKRIYKGAEMFCLTQDELDRREPEELAEDYIL